MADAKFDTIDSELRARKIVQKIYTNGSDNRSQKNGSPGKLIEKVMNKEKHLMTCGIYSLLGTECRAYVNSKERRRNGEVNMLKAIARLIKSKYQENSGDCYVRLDEVGKCVLDEVLEMEEFSGKRMKNVFKVEAIFTLQERCKITPKEAR